MIRNLNTIGLRPTKDEKRVGCHYESINPRAFDSARAIRGCLDKPSMTAGITECNIYTEPSLLNYRAGAPYGSILARSEDYAVLKFMPKNSLNYAVNNAQIQYYVDEETQLPFYGPAYDMEARDSYAPFVDPMGAFKPCFSRNVNKVAGYSNLSFISDTSYHREDIMARQQTVNNQRRSEPFL